MAVTTKTKKTTKKVVAPVIDAQVEEVKPSAKRSARRAVKEITADAEAELVGEKITDNLPKKRLSDDGTVNVENLPSKQKEYYASIAKVLNEKDLTSISSYGSDLQRAMDTYSSDFLKQSFDSKAGIESAQFIFKKGILLSTRRFSFNSLIVSRAQRSKIKAHGGIFIFLLPHPCFEPATECNINLIKQKQ